MWHFVASSSCALRDDSGAMRRGCVRCPLPLWDRAASGFSIIFNGHRLEAIAANVGGAVGPGLRRLWESALCHVEKALS